MPAIAVNVLDHRGVSVAGGNLARSDITINVRDKPRTISNVATRAFIFSQPNIARQRPSEHYPDNRPDALGEKHPASREAPRP